MEYRHAVMSHGPSLPRPSRLHSPAAERQIIPRCQKSAAQMQSPHDEPIGIPTRASLGLDIRYTGPRCGLSVIIGDDFVVYPRRQRIFQRPSRHTRATAAPTMAVRLCDAAEELRAHLDGKQLPTWPGALTHSPATAMPPLTPLRNAIPAPNSHPPPTRMQPSVERLETFGPPWAPTWVSLHRQTWHGLSANLPRPACVVSCHIPPPH